jgi:hypothetical protein
MSTAASQADSTPDRLDLYRLRDDLSRSYNPANAHERMLVTAIAQAWQRLQRAYDAEERFFAKRDMLEIIGSNVDEFKTITRYVSECERARRHAVAELERTQRRRSIAGGFSPNARRHAVPADATPPPEPGPEPAVAISSSEIHPIEKIVDRVAASEPGCYIGLAAKQTPGAIERKGESERNRKGSQLIGHGVRQVG